MDLILIRHGLPERQETDGGKADPPLSTVGQAQARAAANWLADEPIDIVYSSPMVRARQTAEPFAEVAQMQIIEREGMAEFDRHADSYIPVEELRKEDPEAWRAMVAGGYSTHIDMHQFHATVVNTLEEVVAAHAGQTVAVFCHGGVINIWTAHVLGFTPRMFFEPRYTSFHRFRCARSGIKTVISLNETAHLRGSGLL